MSMGILTSAATLALASVILFAVFVVIMFFVGMYTDIQRLDRYDTDRRHENCRMQDEIRKIREELDSVKKPDSDLLV